MNGLDIEKQAFDRIMNEGGSRGYSREEVREIISAGMMEGLKPSELASVLAPESGAFPYPPTLEKVQKIMNNMQKYGSDPFKRKNMGTQRAGQMTASEIAQRTMEKKMGMNIPPEYMRQMGKLLEENIISFNAEQNRMEIKPKDASAEALATAQKTIKEMEEILTRVQSEPLILYTIDRLTKDKKHAFVKKGDTDLRIASCPDLDWGDEVLLHPKTFQIVERIGKPPLEASRFSPDTIPDVQWSDIGGLEDAKADMIEAIEMPHSNKELFAFYKKPDVKGILLSGPPGCGKTMLGKAAAASLSRIYGRESARTGFLYVKGPEILNQYVGQTEQTIRDMFFDAYRHKQERGYPAIIFLDEADAILAARGTRNVGIGNTIVPMFLTEMDGLEASGAIVIIATNRPDVLDPAIVRDGRIDRKVMVTRPNQLNATQILRLNLQRVPLADGEGWGEMGDKMAEAIYSHEARVAPGVFLRDIINGAMLANTVNIAVSFAIRRDMASGKQSGVTMDDALAAINRIQTQSAGILHTLEHAA